MAPCIHHRAPLRRAGAARGAGLRVRRAGGSMAAAEALGAARYFTRWYKADVKGRPCEDFCVLQHSNRIASSDGEEYTIYSCIRGRLIEVNENILSSPALLQEKPSTEGYIAVVLPKFEESKSVTQGLLTPEEYKEVLLKRQNSSSGS